MNTSTPKYVLGALKCDEQIKNQFIKSYDDIIRANVEDFKDAIQQIESQQLNTDEMFRMLCNLNRNLCDSLTYIESVISNVIDLDKHQKLFLDGQEQLHRCRNMLRITGEFVCSYSCDFKAKSKRAIATTNRCNIKHVLQIISLTLQQLIINK